MRELRYDHEIKDNNTIDYVSIDPSMDYLANQLIRNRRTAGILSDKSGSHDYEARSQERLKNSTAESLDRFKFAD